METNESCALELAILDTARRIITSKGYAALSMRRVAREIGYSATSIYLHYESKDALVHALIDEGMERLREALLSASSQEADPVTRIEKVLRAYVQFGLENPELYEIMFMLHPQPMQRYPTANYRRARRNLDIIADVLGQASGDPVPAIDARLSATAVWSAVHGVLALIVAGRLDASLTPEAVIDRVVAHLMAGLERAAG